MSKYAIFLMSDPNGGDESLGRAFNGLALAADAQEAGDDVAVVFAAAGTRWPAVMQKLDHPLHGLYESVREAVVGASCGCAATFGATKGVEACGLPLLTDQTLAGTPGLAGLRHYVESGFRTFVF